MNHSTELTDSARAVVDATQRLSRVTMTRPSMTPAEIADVLGDLAAAVAALPQIADRLSAILEQTKGRHALQMDGMTETEDPDLAIDAARHHLTAIGEPTLGLYRLLDAAHNETAHIAVGYTEKPTQANLNHTAPIARRPEEREPPVGAGEHTPGPPR